MKQLKNFFLSLIAIVSLVACDSAKTSDEILTECGSGVVMVANQFYYKVTEVSQVNKYQLACL